MSAEHYEDHMTGAEHLHFPSVVVPATLGGVVSENVNVHDVMHQPSPKRQRREGPHAQQLQQHPLMAFPPPPQQQPPQQQLQQQPQQSHPRGVARRWTGEEETTLRLLVEEVGTGKWAHVAERLGSGRTASGVEQHWQIMTGQRKRNGKTSSANNNAAAAAAAAQFRGGDPTTMVVNGPSPSYYEPQMANYHMNMPPNQYQQQYAFNQPQHHRYGPPSTMYGAPPQLQQQPPHHVPQQLQMPPQHHMMPPQHHEPAQHLRGGQGGGLLSGGGGQGVTANSPPPSRGSGVSLVRHASERGVAHRWTADEESRLRTLVAEVGKGKWAVVAENLGTGRSASGVEQHWQIMIGQRKRNSSQKAPLKPTLSNASNNSASSNQSSANLLVAPNDDASPQDVRSSTSSGHLSILGVGASSVPVVHSNGHLETAAAVAALANAAPMPTTAVTDDDEDHRQVLLGGVPPPVPVPVEDDVAANDDDDEHEEEQQQQHQDVERERELAAADEQQDEDDYEVQSHEELQRTEYPADQLNNYVI